MNFNVDDIESQLSIRKQKKLIELIHEYKYNEIHYQLIYHRWNIRYIYKNIDCFSNTYYGSEKTEPFKLSDKDIYDSLNYLEKWINDNPYESLSDHKDRVLFIFTYIDLFRYHFSCHHYEKSNQIYNNINLYIQNDSNIDKNQFNLNYLDHANKIIKKLLNKDDHHDDEIMIKVESLKESSNKDDINQIINIFIDDIIKNELNYNYRSHLEYYIKNDLSIYIYISNILWKIIHTSCLINNLMIRRIDFNNESIVQWIFEKINYLYHHESIKKDEQKERLKQLSNLICKYIHNPNILEKIIHGMLNN